MRYLKYFEAIKEYYFEIDYNEFSEKNYFGKNVRDFFNKEETKEIENIMLSKYKRMPSLYNKLDFLNNSSNVNIFKIVDEWYYIYDYTPVINDGHYYKCDQLEGLIKCLKEKIL